MARLTAENIAKIKPTNAITTNWEKDTHTHTQRTKRQNAATPYDDFVVVVAVLLLAAAFLVCCMRCNK